MVRRINNWSKLMRSLFVVRVPSPPYFCKVAHVVNGTSVVPQRLFAAEGGGLPYSVDGCVMGV